METLTGGHHSAFLRSTVMFLAVYLLGYFVMFKNWIKHRHEASSSLMSLAHGTPAVILSAYSIYQSYKHSQIALASPNTAYQNMVLDYSIGYFVTDTLHYIIFTPGDALFIAHHLATIYVLSTCRLIVQRGAVAILVVLLLAEVTSPCQNTWSLARFRKVDVPAAAGYYELISPFFFAIYAVVRVFIVPLFVFKMGLFFVSGAADGLVPRWAWMSWIVVIVGGIIGSILWFLNQLKDWHRSRIGKEAKKFR